MSNRGKVSPPLLGLDEQRTMMAIGIAASQRTGLYEQFGTMAKPLHPGAAARAGIASALLAVNGFTGSERATEAPRGFAQSVSTKCDWSQITNELDERFEIAFNTHKPFAYDIVIHPSIDGCAQLRNENGLKADDVEWIELRVYPRVLQFTGKRAPRAGLEGKFSVYHACAAVIVFGRAGEAEFGDAIVARPDVAALRDRLVATVDESIREETANVTAVCRDGRHLQRRVEHAIGSLERPITDGGLAEKFRSLAGGVVGKERSAPVIEGYRCLAALANCREFVAIGQG